MYKRQVKGFLYAIYFIDFAGNRVFQVIGVSTGLAAERLANVLGPAELPPASFAGEQFVDSTGCVFLRAGSYGAIKWVPRVTQQRKLVCGFEPSFASSKTTVKKAMPLSVQTPVKRQTPVLAGPAERPKTNSVPWARKPGSRICFFIHYDAKKPALETGANFTILSNCASGNWSHAGAIWVYGCLG